MKALLATIVLVLLSTWTVEAAPVDGTQWIKWSQSTQEVYVQGLIDGWLVIEADERVSGFSSSPLLSNLVACMRPLNLIQVTAIVSQYIRQNTHLIAIPMSILVREAIEYSCPPQRVPKPTE